MLEIIQLYFLFHIYTSSVVCSQNERGWIPISNAEIYRRFGVDIVKPNEYQLRDDFGDTRLDLTTETAPEHVIQVVRPQQLYGDFVVNDIKAALKKNVENKLSAYNECEQIGPLKCVKSNTDQHTGNGNAKYIRISSMQTTIPQPTRQAKMIDHQQDNIHDLLLKEVVLNKMDKNYEVTENVDEIDVKNLGPRNVEDFENGKLSKNIDSNNNLTDKLLNILQKYNLKDNPDSSNYAKSRVPRVNTPKDQFVLLPVPLQYFKQNNNSKHLSIDPLIALFLSNYGNYLSNSKLVNNYSNLYRLAYIYFQNNQPHGNYKIFSDTDSWN